VNAGHLDRTPCRSHSDCSTVESRKELFQARHFHNCLPRKLCRIRSAVSHKKSARTSGSVGMKRTESHQSGRLCHVASHCL
jgi:hypothetical protein